MKYPTLREAALKGKRVILRSGFDVPIQDGKVVDDSRIEAMVPTIEYLLKNGAAVILLSHQGRPKGKVEPQFTQKPLVPVLTKLLKVDVKFSESVAGPEAHAMAKTLKSGEVLLLENVRFDPREKEKKDISLAKDLAEMADLYVNDAFTNCHRDHTSMTGIPKFLPSYMGFQLQKEIEGLSKAVDHPARPLALIISGAKMETKVPVIERFLGQGDDILLGGCIANTFIAARGFDIGTSKYEAEWVEKSQEIMLESEKKGNALIHVPRDAVLATSATEDAVKVDLPVEDIEGDMSVFDIGKVTVARYIDILAKAKTIIWNGPLGLYELNRFSHATKRIAEAIRKATEHGAVSIIGGGDTLDFHERYGYPMDCYTFVSTGGGAMLEYVSGKELPALKVLEGK